MSPSPYLLSRFTTNVPLPTLYAGDAVRKPKLSVIEVLLYNMASMLAGVAAGYDVRMSNVSPLHPSLLSEVPALKAIPKVAEMGENELQPAVADDSGQGAEWLPKPPTADVPRKFAANTYHGTGKTHPRTALSGLTYAPLEPALEMIEAQKQQHQQSISRRGGGSQPYYTPVQRTPQHQLHQQSQAHPQPPPLPPPIAQQQPSTFSTTSGLGSSALYSSSLGSQCHTQPPTPSPRRKISTSSFPEQLSYSPFGEGINASNAQVFEELHMDGGVGPPPLYMPSDYPRNGPSYSNDGGAYGAGAHRTGYFGSNYFPYRPELSYVYERDCKSYPDYSYDYYNYQYEMPAPPAVVAAPAAQARTQLQTRTPPPRVPQMGVTAAGHRRTPSTVSNNSNILLGTGYAIEPEELLTLPAELYDYNNLNLDYKHETYREPVPAVVPPPTKQELYASSPKILNRLAGGNTGVVTGTGTGTGTIVSTTTATSSLSRLREYETSFALGTPTNPTPPDSLTSDDSSYLSAKEGSISSQHSRVRFSPEAYLDAALPPTSLGRRMTAPITSTVASAAQQQRRQMHASSARLALTLQLARSPGADVSGSLGLGLALHQQRVPYRWYSGARRSRSAHYEYRL
ncbi:uncharacterized protein LOC115627670 [Scaptodrosophila lebanonensis]|uniref:Uncharacterized protein LOC115627670 n=1 Tax=Drosophila lebanonensis TaxID=7225 RepID=A0A6J2TRI9_DROLE|nr:uncharacterized protein LOC115627670 [Scaptodrosophila lebanonensis]